MAFESAGAISDTPGSPTPAGGALLGWLYLWIARKLTARMQGRQGPPFYQPFFDFVKLVGKETVVPGGVNRAIFYALPLASVIATTLARICTRAQATAEGLEGHWRAVKVRVERQRAAAKRPARRGKGARR